MKRICLFAGYDNKNIIHDYVVYYLKELSTVADVYYMADNEISEHEKAKITPYVKGAYGFNHKKYDFGSWQELIKIIGWEKLSEYDELILANDSVFGPLYPIKELFEKIEKDRQWEVCGMDRVYNADKDLWYISSYFLIFKNRAFTSNFFKTHLEKLNNNIGYNEAVKYMERPFMAMFYNNGFCVKSLAANYSYIDDFISNHKSSKIPFLKKKPFFAGNIYKLDDIIKYINDNTSYKADYIKNYVDLYSKNNKNGAVKKLSLQEKLKNIRRWILSINIKKHKKHIIVFGKKIYHKTIEQDNLESPIKLIKDIN